MRMKTKFPILALVSLLFVNISRSQNLSYVEHKNILFRISEECINIQSADKYFEFEVAITNRSDSAFLLYGFRIVDPGPAPISEFKQPRNVGGNALVVLKKNKIVPFVEAQYPPDNKLTHGVNGDSASFVTGLVKAEGEWTRENMIVVKSRSEWRGKLFAKLSVPRILKGQYHFFMIFYCGRNIPNLIDRKIISLDERVNNAFLFQGFIQSDTSKIVVH